MPRNPPPGYTRIVPYLLYEDTAAALDWLAKAFGFRERFRHPVGGRIDHAEMEFAGGLIMLATPGTDHRSPRRLGQATVVIHVYVDDVRAHFERAKAAGATIDVSRRRSHTGQSSTRQRIQKGTSGSSRSKSGNQKRSGRCRPSPSLESVKRSPACRTWTG